MGKRVVSRLKDKRPRHHLRGWRKFRGFTQEKLAGRVGLSVSSISQLENNDQGYSQQTLEALADALECEPGDLLMRDPSDKTAPWSLLASLKPASREKVADFIQILARADGRDAA